MPIRNFLLEVLLLPRNSVYQGTEFNIPSDSPHISGISMSATLILLVNQGRCLLLSTESYLSTLLRHCANPATPLFQTHASLGSRSCDMCLVWFSHKVVSASATPWTVALQVPLSIGFSRQGHWNGLSCPPPGDLPDLYFQGIFIAMSHMKRFTLLKPN